MDDEHAWLLLCFFLMLTGLALSIHAFVGHAP